MATATETETRGVYPYKVERPEKASQSLLKRIDVCPFSGALYIDHKGGPQTHAMARGDVFHDFTERATNLLLEQGEPEMPAEVAKDLMQAVIEERTDVALPAQEQEACRIMAWNWGSATYLDLEHLVGVESMLELELGEWTIRGKLDRAEIVNGEAHIYDYKSSLHMDDQETFEEDFQTIYYALLLAEGVPEGETVPLARGIDTFHLYQVFPRYTRTDTGELVDRHAIKDRAQLADFKRTVATNLAKLDEGLTNGKWAASPGHHCHTCPASSKCPIPRELRDVKTIGTAGEALEVATWLGFTALELKTQRESLKGWVDQNDPVVVGDEVWDFTYSESSTLAGKKKEALLDYLEGEGKDPAEFFSLRKSTKFDKRKVER